MKGEHYLSEGTRNSVFLAEHGFRNRCHRERRLDVETRATDVIKSSAYEKSGSSKCIGQTDGKTIEVFRACTRTMERACRQLTELEPTGRKRRGSSKTKWMDALNRVLEIVGRDRMMVDG